MDGSQGHEAARTDDEPLVEAIMTNISDVSSEAEHDILQELARARVAAVDAEISSQAVQDEVRGLPKVPQAAPVSCFRTLRSDTGTSKGPAASSRV